MCERKDCTISTYGSLRKMGIGDSRSSTSTRGAHRHSIQHTYSVVLVGALLFRGKRSGDLDPHHLAS